MDVTGLIIRSSDYGDSDKLVTIATAEGRITARAKGVRRAGSKLKGFVGVLNFGEFGLTEGKAGYILSGASVDESFLNCWTDANRYAAAMLCLEIYEKCSREGDGVSFVSLLKALEEVNYGSFYPPAAALRFGVCAAAESGIDVTEGVFPPDISAIFSALLVCEDTEDALLDAGVDGVKKCIMHLSAGFFSELGVRLTVAGEIFRMDGV